MSEEKVLIQCYVSRSVAEQLKAKAAELFPNTPKPHMGKVIESLVNGQANDQKTPLQKPSPDNGSAKSPNKDTAVPKVGGTYWTELRKKLEKQPEALRKKLLRENYTSAQRQAMGYKE